MLGKCIQELRMQKGLSMSELAERSGVTKSYLNALERGIKTNPSIQILEKIAGVLDMELGSLVRYVYDRQAGNAPFDSEWIELICEMKRSGISKEILKSWKDAWANNEDEDASKYSS
ncbi:helix-turn-helix domain-containing protein [Brevibacillus choshinensis]|uniref:helix-turn-helix domain-containing protein n=1 Tax=Brevibacillus choshinensis TaxID=54911 RepID=UPI002E21CF17|nr:helix-turn-helix domain-containing protein [Brevibacillus choshinensis]MED4753023.1 helix-turn-helix domain-containing protein [Brevibacillus choshinensis]MED4781400.1 helix-turn-helix domain-containing protein [Brevibacillus choshinensis]